MKRHLYRLGSRLRALSTAERAAWRLDAERLGDAVERLGSGIEATVLSTCARSELIVASDAPLHAGTLRALFGRLVVGPVDAADTLALEIERDEHAVRRLFRVVAGLDSPLVGEREILGQWRHAVDAAVGVGVGTRSGSVLRPLGQRALAVGREARRIGGLRADYARAIERWLCGHREVSIERVGVVGSGRFAARLARQLRRDGRHVTLFAHHVDRARTAASGGVEVRPAAALDARLDRLDLLVTAVRSTEPVLGAEALDGRTRRLLVVDLSTPSAVDPAVAERPGVELTTLDRLGRDAGRSLVDRAARSGLERAEHLVHRRADDFVRAWRVRQRLAGRRLVLAAHGGGDGSAANRAVEDLAARLRRRLGRLPVETAYHLGEPGFAAFAERRDAIVLPLLTSDGWYFRKLAAALGAGPELLPPMGTDRRLVERVVDTLRERLARERAKADETAVLVVGHGTRRQATSGAASHRLARAIAGALPGARVEAAFLDQDPGLGEVARRLAAERATLAVVPFLLGHGSHATDDIDAALLGDAAPRRRIDLPPLFDLPRLEHVLAAILTTPPERSGTARDIPVRETDRRAA